ncbi:Peptidase family M23 [uncultured archaeon]|nr:Peptidase family M23 [uncultured archaeon]
MDWSKPLVVVLLVFLVAVCALRLLETPAPNLFQGAPDSFAAPGLLPPASSFASSSASLSIYEAPVVFNADNQPVLFYEIYASNYAPRTLSKLEVLDGQQNVIYSISGAALNATLLPMQNWSGQTPIRMWIELSGKSIPSSVSHRLYFAGSSTPVSGASSPVMQKPLLTISPPLRNNTWLALNAPDNFEPHRNAIFQLNSNVYVPQRFAIDWVIGKDGALGAGNRSSNFDDYAYGQDVLAVADGTVVLMQDGVPDNVPGAKPPININRLGGNFIVLDLHNGYYAFYGHMIPGSLRVKVGGNVSTGQVIGSLGNSGNSDAAHLHFHICDSMDYLFCHGQPYAFSSYYAAPAVADGKLANRPLLPYSNSMPGNNEWVQWRDGNISSSTLLPGTRVGSLIYVSSFEGGSKYKTLNNSFTVLDLHGSFREMGRQYGYLMREEMQEAYARTMNETAAMGMPKQYVDEAGDTLYNSNSQKYVELMQGMSETSGLTLQQHKELNGGVISLITAYMVKSANDATPSNASLAAASAGNVMASDPRLSACSGVAFWGDYSADGKLYFGRNWDMVKSLLVPYLPYMTLAVYHPDSGHSVANLEWVGEVYTETAMNDQGLFLELNNGQQADAAHYEGRPFAAVKLLDFMFDSSDMNDIYREFNTTLPSDSYLIQVADQNAAYSYEWSSTMGARRRSENVSGLLVTYNSFVPPYPASWEGVINPPTPTADDMRRANFLKLANSPEYKGQMEVEKMKQLLSIGYREGGGMLPDNVYQVIAVPADYTMWIHGQNYSGWEEVDLKPLFGK